MNFGWTEHILEEWFDRYSRVVDFERLEIFDRRHAVICVVWTIFGLVVASVWWCRSRSVSEPSAHSESGGLRGGARRNLNMRDEQQTGCREGFSVFGQEGYDGPMGGRGAAGGIMGILEDNSKMSSAGQSRNVSRPKLSIALENILFVRTANAKERFDVLGNSVQPFNECCGRTDLFPVITVESDEDKRQVMTQLEDLNAFGNGLQRHKVLFTSYEKSRIAVIRQLQPTFHIESDPSIAAELRGKISNLLFMKVTPTTTTTTIPTTTTTAATNSITNNNPPDYDNLKDFLEVLKVLLEPHESSSFCGV